MSTDGKPIPISIRTRKRIIAVAHEVRVFFTR